LGTTRHTGRFGRGTCAAVLGVLATTAAAIYGFLADAVVVLHAAYVAFVVLALVAILVGAALGWSWVRNAWFRAIHLAMIAVVALQAVAGILCPLTVLEDWLRRQAGQSVEAGTFIGRWVHELLFVDAPSWAFTTAYCLFAALVAGSWLLIPPRRRGR